MHLILAIRVEGDPVTRIYALIRDLANSPTAMDTDNAKQVPMDTIRELVRSRGFTDEQLQQCLQEFDQCNIWSAAGNTLKIYN